MAAPTCFFFGFGRSSLIVSFMFTARVTDFGSPRRALLGAAREALGTPAIVLAASYLGFGSLVRSSDLTVWHGLASTVTGWALPGQIALVELYSVGASLVAIAVAVALINMRLLPMTVSLMPILRQPGRPRWRSYAAAHLVAVTGWAGAMIRCPALPPDQRMPYFVGFSGTLWVVTMVATAVGFVTAGAVPGAVALGLVFLNPIYFLLVFMSDLRHRARALALMLGMALGPPLHLAVPEWSLMLTGVIAGSLAILFDRLMGKRRA